MGIRVLNKGTGEVLVGLTTAEVVNRMRALAWFETEDKHDYMEDAARRVKLLFGITIAATTATEFLTDLHEAGLVVLERIDNANKGGKA